LVISSTQTSNYDADNRIFTLSQREFNDARKSMDRITAQARNAASDVKDVIVYNALAPVVAKKDKQVRLRKNPTTKRFQQVLMNSSGLDEEDHAALVEMVTSDATRIARSQPEKLSALRDEVQLATLDALIVEYETMLSEGHNESDWQNFFQDQPLLLSMAFGYPIIQVEGHASVGGRKISGFGEKIADFLYQNGQTGNVALFEIKTPSSPLLETREYRGGLHAAHKELSGSVSQILDQRYQLQLHFASKIAASEMFALKSYAIDCCVVSGTLPTEKVKQKSLELIRHNSKDVTIITYDELLIKLKQLSQFLAADKESKPAK
ncbi:MAG: Shedu immune nuclease family protein, partial [Pseudomonadota bacterium]